ncbi:hypothetical protein [Halobacillus salinus]|uniref:hypothetical protein n=1 Tax=Halobacillus salinus TaxID=192814 RepID=UPI0009A64119|nr:hypothetical protein [Halobacillus salinus]
MKENKLGFILLFGVLIVSLLFNYHLFDRLHERQEADGRLLKQAVRFTLIDVEIMNASVWEDVMTTEGKYTRFEVLSGKIKQHEGMWRSLSRLDGYGYEMVDILSSLSTDLYEMKEHLDHDKDITALKEEIDLKVNALVEILSFAEDNLPEDDPIAWAKAFKTRGNPDSEMREVIRDQYRKMNTYRGINY